MASAFASLFKSRKKGSNKENESTTANIHRGKPASSSMRHQKASRSEGNKNRQISGGVYLGDLDPSAREEGFSFEEQTQNIQQQKRTKASSVIFTASPWTRSKWFQSPYDVVTAPKTKKSSRSCPGGAICHPPGPPSVASLRHSRHHSPPSGYGSTRHTSSYHHQQQYPTIHEVYENYAPLPSSDQSGDNGNMGTMQRQRWTESSNVRSLMVQPSRTLEHGSVRANTSRQLGHSSLVGVSHTVENNSYNPLRQRIFGANNHSRANCDIKYRHATSEYGSADPSPTNQFPAVPSVSSTSDIHAVNGAEEFENTDYDSDSDAMPTDLVQLCTQQLRKVNGKCKTYKETARRYKSKNLKLQAELQMVNEQLVKEKGKNQSLSSQLSEAKKEMHRLHSCFVQISENVHPSHHLSSRNSHLQTRTPLNPTSFLTSGAGEALCSRTDSNSDLLMPLNKLSNHEARKDHQQQPIHSLFSQQFNSCLRNVARRQEEEEDELITFRRNDFLESDCNEEFDLTEDPRNSNAKCSTLNALNSSACKLSPPPHGGRQNKIEEEVVQDVTDKPIPMREDDGYSTMLQNQGDNKGTEHKQAENEHTTNSIIDSQSSSNGLLPDGCEEEGIDILRLVNSIHNNGEEIKYSRARHTPPILFPVTSLKSNDHLPLRKSFSETDLSRICLEDMHNSQQDLLPLHHLENAELYNDGKDVWDEEEDPSRAVNKVIKIAKQRPHRYGKQVSNTSSFRSSTRSPYCCYSPKRGDYSSSYSSDDDAIRVLAKQLRKRGEVVHFKPSQRKSLVVGNCHDKLFRHFGQQERNAIAQFEYLKEMPTDVSGLLSSPDAQSPS